MASYDGTFVWYELMTSDAAASEAFYREVIGWRARPAEGAPMPYTIFSAGDDMVAGMMALSPGMLQGGAKAGWIGSIAVSNVDAKIEELRAAGGKVHMGPSDIEKIGRFAIVADPQGVAFVLFDPIPPAGGIPKPPFANSPGHIGWNELRTTVLDPAFDFYAKLFGWTEKGSLDMGPEWGMYRMFGVGAGGETIGGMMKQPASVSGEPQWKFYFVVDGIEAAIARLKSAGGQLNDGPHQVPGGAWAAQATDPHGVRFGLTSAQK
jgi:predicted enzyme related to lactoylglutathione lyase